MIFVKQVPQYFKTMNFIIYNMFNKYSIQYRIVYNVFNKYSMQYSIVYNMFNKQFNLVLLVNGKILLSNFSYNIDRRFILININQH